MIRAMITACLIAAVCSVHAAAEKTKPMVGVYYFPGWYRSGGEKAKPPYDRNTDWSEWRGAIAKAATPRPVCGFYDDSNPKLWSYFDRWITSHGIDFIAFDWYYNDGQEYLSESLDKGFLGCKASSGIKFCLHWCNHGGTWWHSKLDQTIPSLEKMIDLASDKYFSRPNYLRIDGKPVLMIYDNDILGSFGDVKTALTAIRKRAAERGCSGLYIVGVYSGADRSQIAVRAESGYDAFCAYTYAWMRGPKVTWDSPTYDYADITDNIVANVHPYLARVAKAEAITYWPSTFSGWDDRPRAGLEKGLVLVGNTPAQFGRMFRSALAHVDPACPVVMVEAWNEWGEGACIEPSKEHGFGYLREIAKAVGKTKPDQAVPSADEIASWSVLLPEELLAAKDNESKPWPVKPAKYYKMGKSRKVADVKLPITIDFSADGVEYPLNDMRIESRDSNGLTLVTTGPDPQIVVAIPETPTAQINRITLDADITMPAGRPAPTTELYFATALLPDFCPFACASLPPFANGLSTLVTHETMCWSSYGTPLTKIRIDPCSEPGARVVLRKLVLSAAPKAVDPARLERSYWIHASLGASLEKGYWVDKASVGALPTPAQVRNAAKLLTDHYAANRLYLVYHNEISARQFGELLRLWRAACPKDVELVASLVLRRYGKDGGQVFSGREIGEVCDAIERELQPAFVGVYDVLPNRDQGEALGVLARRFPGKLIRIGIQPEERIEEPFVAAVQDTWSGLCHGATNEDWQSPGFGAQTLRKWVAARNTQTKPVAWDLVAVAWDYSVTERGEYPGYDDAAKNMPLPPGRNKLAVQEVCKTADPAVLAGFSSDLIIIEANSRSSTRDGSSNSIYECLKVGRAYDGYFAKPLEEIAAVFRDIRAGVR